MPEIVVSLSKLKKEGGKKRKRRRRERLEKRERKKRVINDTLPVCCSKKAKYVECRFLFLSCLILKLD